MLPTTTRVEIRAKFSLFLIKHHNMMTYRGEWRLMEVNVSFMPQPLYPQGKSPDTRWIRGWMGPKASMNMVVKKNLWLCWELNSPVMLALRTTGVIL
jgi:hypothetical protein